MSDTGYDREEHKKAVTKDGDKLELFIYEDKIENIHQYGVTWYGLCGYSSVSIHTNTETHARKLLSVLKTVIDHEVN